MKKAIIIFLVIITLILSLNFIVMANNGKRVPTMKYIYNVEEQKYILYGNDIAKGIDLSTTTINKISFISSNLSLQYVNFTNNLHNYFKSIEGSFTGFEWNSVQDTFNNIFTMIDGIWRILLIPVKLLVNAFQLIFNVIRIIIVGLFQNQMILV